ncbi:X-Pro dipeptidyl-peptidase (S15 family) [Synechococcus sp. PCC 7335]|uniref:S9 family peptidase n=1 Tax=Synechococcus sp. (strain ATCC 29403 / PCC 7335) TaxID=91464 RepID=UPI00017EE829|nr:S9 family peptidase [Synechococcus sp. PCC 7335]EDX83615.1 X-Pro dipeptidyl-peptidase (S15 family) [Synechococcus sp. PCC 7335]
MKRFYLKTGLMLASASMITLGPIFNPLPFVPMSVATAEDLTNQSTLPPLIERELFFSDPEISGARLSPNGQFVAFRKPLDGIVNVWVKGIDEPMDAARPVTADVESPIMIYFWSADGRYILYGQDTGGNENFRLYAVEPEVVGEAGVGARDLTPIENVTATVYAIPKETPNQIVIGLNDRDPRVHDVYRLDLTTGDRTLLIQNDGTVAAWAADHKGDIRLAYRQSLENGQEILKVEENGDLTPIYTCSLEEACGLLQFHPNDQQIYLKTNKGVDLAQLELLDVDTGETELVETDPEQQVDFGGALFSPATDELVATYYVGDRRRIYPKSDEWSADLAFLQQQLPDVELSVDSVTTDDQLALVSVQSDVNPGAMYLFDRSAQSLEKLYDVSPALPSEHLASAKPIRYEARDGVEIPAYLTLPKGVSPENLPVIVFPHGGPWGRDSWGYSPVAQFYANRGYAVLQPNFRGSAGYGKAFLNAGNQQWGTGVMQHDVTDGMLHLIDEGIADPERVGIMGFSYGGYATLAGLAFTPERYAAGASVVGPSSLITLMENIPPYWVPIQDSMDLRVGDPSDPVDRDRLAAQSPLFSADKIQAPLLVVQGANDPRVLQQESDQIVKALRDLGRPVEYLVAPDEGHGFRKEINALAMTAALERFFAEHLGGRYQSEMSPELATQLESLTVDIDTIQ